MFDNRKLRRQIRDLKDELKTSQAVVSTLSRKNFDQAIKIIELKQSLDLAEQERDHWKKLAHEMDAARLKTVRRIEIK